MNPFNQAWTLLKRVVLPESKEPFSPEMIMWHLKQRQLGNNKWEKMPRPEARITHGFHGEPVPENANPPVAVADVTANTDEDWQKKIQMRQADDENVEARREWYGV